MAQQHDKKATKKFGPMHFIMGFGIVSMLMDIVYEAALSARFCIPWAPRLPW